jgi:hypothetical protein
LALLAAALLAGCGGTDMGAAPASASASTSPGNPGADGKPAIVVETPAPGATVTSPLTVAGNADVFEANVTVIVLGAGGEELARDFTTAECGTGCRGDFSLELLFTVSEEQQGTVVVQDDDAAGTGTPPHVVEIPVTLAPS